MTPKQIKACSDNLKSYEDRISFLKSGGLPVKYCGPDKSCDLCKVFREIDRKHPCLKCPLGPDRYRCVKENYYLCTLDTWWTATIGQLLNTRNILKKKYEKFGYQKTLSEK